MTARPAPLTMTQEQEADAERRINAAIFNCDEAISSTVAYRLWDEMTVTRAQLAAVTLRLDRLAEAVYRALADWSDGPPTMKETADWANRNAPMLALARADALSPTQPTPTEGNES